MRRERSKKWIKNRGRRKSKENWWDGIESVFLFIFVNLCKFAILVALANDKLCWTSIELRLNLTFSNLHSFFSLYLQHKKEYIVNVVICFLHSFYLIDFCSTWFAFIFFHRGICSRFDIFTFALPLSIIRTNLSVSMSFFRIVIPKKKKLRRVIRLLAHGWNGGNQHFECSMRSLHFAMIRIHFFLPLD